MLVGESSEFKKLRTEFKELERERYRTYHSILSLENKLDQTDIFSDEFDLTVDTIFNYKEKLDSIARSLVKTRAHIAELELKDKEDSSLLR